MFKSLSRKKPPTSHRRFSDYYSDWIAAMKTTHLPNLRHHMSNSTPNLLAAHVEIIHHHFKSYYQTLDLAAAADVTQILFPSGHRNALEIPFLWLGDIHPYAFTNLIRSFLLQDDTVSENDVVLYHHNHNHNNNIKGFEEQHENGDVYDFKKLDDVENEAETELTEVTEEEEIEVGKSCEFLKKQWPLMNAWKIQSPKLTGRIDQIERGLRLMVPALMDRVRKAQAGFVRKVGSGDVAAAVAAAEMEEEMVGIVMDANRLRKDVISEIVSVTSVYQAALFLEGLAQCLVGIRDEKLVQEFKKCKLLIK
ncbi:protein INAPERTURATE POLLEN1-like [Bidens hawaiensis]|uniref:protein INAPERTURATE POLLEN1-like n=1 Tax=Bidens hawaiensis TaxID=980011 RepID=UPI00404B518C